MTHAVGPLPSVSVLVAEPNAWLGGKTAGLLGREDSVWCVAQVADREGLLRGAALLQPEVVLADLGLLQEASTVGELRQVAPCSRVLAMVDSACEPYVSTALRIGADQAVEKGRIAEDVLRELRVSGEHDLVCAATA